jgi:hypothetical protein
LLALRARNPPHRNHYQLQQKEKRFSLVAHRREQGAEVWEEQQELVYFQLQVLTQLEEVRL